MVVSYSVVFPHPLDEMYTNFKEAPIDFPPTYKYDLRCDDAYAKHRTPSYTVSIRKE